MSLFCMTGIPPKRSLIICGFDGPVILLNALSSTVSPNILILYCVLIWSTFLKIQSRSNRSRICFSGIGIPNFIPDGEISRIRSNLPLYILSFISNYLTMVDLPEPGFPIKPIEKCGSRYCCSARDSVTPSVTLLCYN